jgi:hypothetical protein
MKYMADQLSPQKVVLNAQEIATSSKQLLRTNIPAKELGQFADLALKSRGQKISTVSLVPPTVSVVNPNFPEIHRMIAEAIEESERGKTAKDEPDPTEEPTTDPTVPGQSAGPTTPGDNPRAANTTDDLKKAC